MVTERRTLGERFKRQRERSGVTLESIAQATKVPASLFAALERGDCSRWPAGLYSRAYVRAYAEAIGINPEEAVEDFSAAFATVVQPDGEPGAAPRARPNGPRLRMTMAEEPALVPARVAWRAGLAAADLAVGFLLAALAQAAGAGVWLAVGAALAYHAAGRTLGDEPLLYHLYLRLRQPAAPPASDPASEVPVGDAARTAA